MSQMWETKQIAHNKRKRNGAIRYIVIHDTGNKAKGADADAHFRYFNGAERSASADFFVDDTKILCVNDYTKYATYHVGDGKGKYGITNENAIGIELCVNEGASYETAFCRLVLLTKALMKTLSIPPERVVRHFDASRKNCPASMREHDWEKWHEFKKLIAEEKNMKFKDIENHFAENAIQDLFTMGVVNGKTDDTFAPDEPITRGEAALIVRNAIRFITGK